MSGTTRLYAEGMLARKREKVAEELQACSNSELEQLVKSQSVSRDSERDLVTELGLFGSENDPLIRAGAAYDIIRDRKGELYAYSLIAAPETYPVKNWRTSLGGYLAFFGGLGSIPLTLFAVSQHDFSNPDLCSYSFSLSIFSTFLSFIGGAYISARGRNYGMLRLRDELKKKSETS